VKVDRQVLSFIYTPPQKYYDISGQFRTSSAYQVSGFITMMCFIIITFYLLSTLGTRMGFRCVMNGLSSASSISTVEVSTIIQ